MPSIGLRSDRAKAAASGGASKSSPKSAVASNGPVAAAPLDSREFQEEIDVTKRLKASEFNALVVSFACLILLCLIYTFRRRRSGRSNCGACKY